MVKLEYQALTTALKQLKRLKAALKRLGSRMNFSARLKILYLKY